MATVDTTTATRDTRRPPGPQRWRATIRTRPATPDGEGGAHRLAVGQPLDEAGDLGAEASPFDGEPEQLGELADEDRQGQPFM